MQLDSVSDELLCHFYGLDREQRADECAGHDEADEERRRHRRQDGEVDQARAPCECRELRERLGGAFLTGVMHPLLHDAPAPPLPAGVAVRRIGDLTYAELLDLIFGSDQVITW